MANYTKAIAVPLSERPYCIGKAELMGYLGCPDSRALERDYLSHGLHWDRRIQKREYYFKSSIAKWLDEHSDKWTEGTYMRERLERKKICCKQ